MSDDMPSLETVPMVCVLRGFPKPNGHTMLSAGFLEFVQGFNCRKSLRERNGSSLSGTSI